MPILERKTASLGVDVGSRTVKLIFVHRHADRVGIGAAGSYDIPPGAIERGVVRNPLGSSSPRRNLAGAHATVSIPSNLASLRWVSLPLPGARSCARRRGSR